MNDLRSGPKTTVRIYDLYQGEAKHVKAMSIEELRASGHFQNHTENELIALIDTVRIFTEIVYSAWSKQRKDAQQTSTVNIPLDEQQQQKAA